MSTSPPSSAMRAACVTLIFSLQAPSSVAAQQLRLEPMWEKGGVDGPPETVWMRIEDATVEDGRVYAVDIAIPEVRVFSISGDLLGSLGGAGEGPGEFARPISIDVVGDSVVVLDAALGRISVFGSALEHGRTSNLDRGVDQWGPLRHVGRVWPARHGWFLGKAQIVARSRPSESVDRHHLLAWRSESIDTLAAWSGLESLMLYRITGG